MMDVTTLIHGLDCWTSLATTGIWFSLDKMASQWTKFVNGEFKLTIDDVWTCILDNLFSTFSLAILHCYFKILFLNCVMSLPYIFVIWDNLFSSTCLQLSCVLGSRSGRTKESVIKELS